MFAFIFILEVWNSLHSWQMVAHAKSRGGSRGTSNNCVGEQFWKRLSLRQFCFPTQVLTYFKSASEILFWFWMSRYFPHAMAYIISYYF